MIYFTFLIVIGLVSIVLYLLLLRRANSNPKKLASLDFRYVEEKWMEIENTAKLSGQSHFSKAIIEADKLTDYVLISKKVRGKTLGERLKNAKLFFSDYETYDRLWFAHKVRNSIVHEADFQLTNHEVKKAIEFYYQALKSLGAIK